ncbi:MAG TPA: prepilin-type N-terminal cleavage/methylation domain-containing protein, partial [Gemmatimonadaceae bacterium]
MQTSPAVVSAPSPSSHRLSGFTLVELLIATVVLAVGLLALTSAGAAIVKLESHGQQLSRVAAAGETRLELLRAQRCAATSGA